MSKILISWIAHNHDFLEDRKTVNTNGPSYSFHQYFWDDYDRHIILYANEKGENSIIQLMKVIQNDFRHTIEPLCLYVEDVINIGEIYPKIIRVLSNYKDDEIDIFFSPGTSAMQMSWYILHTSLKFKTRLLQTRAAQYTKSGTNPELIEIKIDDHPEIFSTAIWEKSMSGEKRKETDYLITKSLQTVYKKAERIAFTDQVTTVIYGDSGTGKEHLAKFIHQNSSRKSKAFISINCSALRDELLESRLFGHKKGSFTGADKNHIGYFEEANGGTIFLDEVGDISPQLQQSLLRILQEGEIQPIGGKTKKIDVRIIVATHRNLYQLCKNEMFRWDLYYRLSVAELKLPNLAERGKAEIKELTKHFLKTKKLMLKKSNILQFSEEAEELILSYPYPGNVRELENLIERFYVFCDTMVETKDLPERFCYPDPSYSLLLEEVEKTHIQKVLKINHKNKTQTAKDLGIVLNTLKAKINKYGLH